MLLDSLKAFAFKAFKVNKTTISLYLITSNANVVLITLITYAVL